MFCTRLLNEATGSLLDDVQLVNTLQTSKVTAAEVSEQLETSEETEIMIDSAREVRRSTAVEFRLNMSWNLMYLSWQGYRSCAQRASILFSILNDLSRIDPMYQFSLDAYIDLFKLSISKSKRSHKLEERITNLNSYHTYAVYRWTRMHRETICMFWCVRWCLVWTTGCISGWEHLSPSVGIGCSKGINLYRHCCVCAVLQLCQALLTLWGRVLRSRSGWVVISQWMEVQREHLDQSQLLQCS